MNTDEHGQLVDGARAESTMRIEQWLFCPWVVGRFVRRAERGQMPEALLGARSEWEGEAVVVVAGPLDYPLGSGSTWSSVEFSGGGRLS